MWANDPQFEQLVKEAWSFRVTGTPMYILTQKLKALKKVLKVLHKNKYAQIASKVAKFVTDVHKIQEELILRPADSQLQECEKLAQDTYQNAVNAEMELLRQQSKVTWLTCNDSNTTYFHAKVKGKYSRHRITSIYDSSNQLITDMDQIQAEFMKFYDDLLGKASHVEEVQQHVIDRGPILTEEQGTYR